MTLLEWVESRMKETGLSREKTQRALADKSGVSYTTIVNTTKGARMGRYDKAEALSKATEWQVSIDVLCRREANAG